MHPLRNFAARYNRLPARRKAFVVASACAIAGTVTGFVLYLALTRELEGGGTGLRLLALFAALIIGVFVGWLGHWVSRTIDTGESHFGAVPLGAAMSAFLLVIFLELCVSAFSDLTKALVEEFHPVMEIAGELTGRTPNPGFAPGDPDVPRLLEAIDTAIAGGPSGTIEEAWRPILTSLYAHIPRTKETAALFARHAEPTAGEISALIEAAFPYAEREQSQLPIEQAENPLLPAPLVARLCLQSVRDALVKIPPPDDPFATGPTGRGLGAGMPGGGVGGPLDPRLLEVTTTAAQPCRQALLDLSASDRQELFRRAMNAVLARHDLYDEAAFGAVGPEASLTTRRAASQALACSRIREGAAEHPAQAPDLCTTILAANPDTPYLEDKPQPDGSGDSTASQAEHAECRDGASVRCVEPAPLLTRARLMALNRALLAERLVDANGPKSLVTTPSIRWGDLVLLFLVWCAAAVALAVALTAAIFRIGARRPILRPLRHTLRGALIAVVSAALAIGLAVILVRLGFLFWMLATNSDQIDLGGTFGLFHVIPSLIRLLAGWGIPGMVSVPAVILVALVLLGFAPHDAKPIVAVALLALILLSSGPVAGGVAMLMLLVAAIWLLPAIGLALVTPYLEPASRLGSAWGFAALGVAALLCVWLLLLHPAGPGQQLYIAAFAVALGWTGAFILAGYPVKEMWPPLALTVALAVFGVASVAEQATFAGALERLHPLTGAPLAEGKAPLPPGGIFAKMVLLPPAPPGEEDELPFPDVPFTPDATEAQFLEVSLAGGVGFWVTIALLAAWSLRRAEEERAAAPG